jgi:phosphate transport system substrate-binding protein
MKTPRLLVLLALLAALPAAFAQSTLTLEGSNTFGKDLGPALASAFESKNPGVSIQIQTPGSGAGLDALIDGRTLVAPTSRVANEDELRRARATGIKLRPHSIGGYGVAVIVNSSNPIRSLRASEVRGIFTGEIKNWKSLGGHDAPIRVLIHDDTTGSALGFRELAMRERPYAKSATALPTDSAILAAIAADPHAIGYSGIGLQKNGIRPILIDGIPANRNAILEGLYPYARTLFLYTNPKTETREVKSLIRFIQSRDGQRILATLGFVPRIHIPFESEGLAP